MRGVDKSRDLGAWIRGCDRRGIATGMEEGTLATTTAGPTFAVKTTLSESGSSLDPGSGVGFRGQC